MVYLLNLAKIAKNIILSGVNSVVLYDKNQINWNDLSTNFYLNENEIGEDRIV